GSGLAVPAIRKPPTSATSHRPPEETADGTCKCRRSQTKCAGSAAPVSSAWLGKREVPSAWRANAGARGAGLAGRLVYWETSSGFSQTANQSAAAFVAAHPIVDDAGKTWDRSRPLSKYQGVDEDADEARVGSWGNAFPHVLSASTSRDFPEEWHRSPFLDAYI